METVSDLASRDRDEVHREFGASGAWIHDLAHGIDARRVTPNRTEKSHGMERTFAEDISDRDELRRILYGFCEEVSYELRHRGLRGRTVTLKARYWNFKTLTRSKTVEVPVNLGKRIYGIARELLARIPQGPLRLLGVQVSSLSDVRTPVQSSLFGAGDVDTPDAADARARRTTQALDALRRRYGRGAVVPASLLGQGDPKRRDREGDAGEE